MSGIDAHVHVWDLDVRPQPWTDAFPVLQRSFAFTDLEPLLEQHDLDGAVIVQAVDSFDETLELLALAESTPMVAGVVGWFDVPAPDLAARLAEARSAPGGGRLVGVRHQLQIEPDKGWLARPSTRAGLATLGAAGLAFDVVVSPEQLPSVLDTVTSVPGTRFVLDHGGKPPIASGELSAWRTDVASLAARPNVAAKLSGLVTEVDGFAWTPAQLRPIAAHLLAVFGPDRLMFGSDWPVCLLAASYDEVSDLAGDLISALTPAEQVAVRGGTAREWYRL